MILKLKAFIYRNTGIYLAYKEENKMITSRETWNKIVDMATNKDYDDLTMRDMQGLIIAMWHAKHGFLRTVLWRSKCG